MAKRKQRDIIVGHGSTQACILPGRLASRVHRASCTTSDIASQWHSRKSLGKITREEFSGGQWGQLEEEEKFELFEKAIFFPGDTEEATTPTSQHMTAPFW